jgi:hypothetical protein
MAKFTIKNIEFKDGQKAIFGDLDDAYLMWDGDADEMVISTVISGVYPTRAGHLTTKQYIDDQLTTISGVSEYPRYYIDVDVNILVNAYGQYVVHHGTLEVAGKLELNTGGMLIIIQE